MPSPWRAGGAPCGEGHQGAWDSLSDPIPAPCLIARFSGKGGQGHAGGVAAQAWLGGGHLLIGEQRPKVAQPRPGCAPSRCRPCHRSQFTLASLLGKTAVGEGEGEVSHRPSRACAGGTPGKGGELEALIPALIPAQPGASPGAAGDGWMGVWTTCAAAHVRLCQCTRAPVGARAGLCGMARGVWGPHSLHHPQELCVR